MRVSLSARRAWIEISMGLDGRFKLWSLSARRAWIEILRKQGCRLGAWSLSARRAWIEMQKIGLMLVPSLVALRKESVDRNSTFLPIREALNVALRKESVDRNSEDWLNAGSLSRRSPQGERG